MDSAAFATRITARAEVRRLWGLTRLTSDLARRADAAVQRHQERQAARMEHPVEGRILAAQDAKRQEYAARMGRSYHRRIKSIAQSQHATVVAGWGGQSDWRHTGGGYCDKWKNAGARWETESSRHYVVLENSRGKEVTRIEVPAHAPIKRQGGWYVQHPGLIDGDLYGILRHGVMTRYNDMHQRTGVSIPLPCLRPPTSYDSHGFVTHNRREIVQEWEHSHNITNCRAQNAHKMAVRAAQWESKTPPTVKPAHVERITRLILRLCNRAQVTYADARAMGYCNQGIRAWCKRRGISADGTATFAQLRGDAQSEAVMRLVAEREAVKIAAKYCAVSESGAM